MSFVRNASQDLVYDSGISSYVSAYQNVSIPTNGPGPAVFVDSQGRALTYNGKALVYGEYEDLVEEWTPNSSWWDIETIIGADTRSYAGKAIVLYNNSEDTTTFTISSPLVAVETSDGSFYTSTTTHTWDKSQDKPVSGDVSDTTPKFATRYVKYYFDVSNPTLTSMKMEKKGSLYALFDCDINITSSFYGSSSFFFDNFYLVAFDFLNSHSFALQSGATYRYFCYECYSLEKIPDTLDVSASTNFSCFCYACYSLKKIPDILDVSNGTDFSYFCNGCSSLQKIPNILNVSNGTNFTSFCSGCYSLKKIPDILDVSKGTSFGSFLSSCRSLKKLPDVLDVSRGTTFNSFLSSCSSLEKLPDVLDLSNGTGSLYGFCESCYALKNLPDILDVSGFTSFGSFCANCYSLKKLPDVLDVSSGTSFDSFCNYCGSLKNLPNVLDVSHGTNFYQFCSGCFSLEKTPETLDVSNVTTSYGMNTFLSYCYSLKSLPDVLDLSAVPSSVSASDILAGNRSLVKANIKLPDKSITSLSNCISISIDSLRYIANNAPTVSGKTLTLGATNISRAGGASGTIIATLTNKGWTVN